MLELYSIEEVARMLNLSMGTVYQYTQQGKMPSVKIGTRRLIRRDALEKWVAEREVRND